MLFVQLYLISLAKIDDFEGGPFTYIDLLR